MPVLPGTNALLTAVEAPGTLGRDGRPTGGGTPVWTGSVPCYLERNEQLLEAAGTVSQGDPRELSTRSHRLIVFAVEGGPMTEIGGPDSTAETILVQDRRDPAAPATHRWTIVGTEYNARGMVADNIILTLDNPVRVDG